MFQMIDGLRKLKRNKAVLDLDPDQFAAEVETTKESQSHEHVGTIPMLF